MTKKKEEQVKKVESEKKYARLPEKLVAVLEDWCQCKDSL